jgi:hypothetical protein
MRTRLKLSPGSFLPITTEHLGEDDLHGRAGGRLLEGLEAAVQGEAGFQEGRQVLREIHYFPGG